MGTEPATSVTDPFGRVWAHDNLWVATDRGCAGAAEGLLAVYDVFAPDGTFIRQVRLVGLGDCEWDKWYFVAGDRLVIVRDYRSSLAVQRGWSVAEQDRGLEYADSGIVIYCALAPVP